MQVRGKKNLVIEKSLAGPTGLFIKFSTLQEYGVDKVFFLENDNVDSSQKNIIFLARGEKASQAIAVAGMYVVLFDHDGHQFLTQTIFFTFFNCSIREVKVFQTR